MSPHVLRVSWVLAPAQGVGDGAGIGETELNQNPSEAEPQPVAAPIKHEPPDALHSVSGHPGWFLKTPPLKSHTSSVIPFSQTPDIQQEVLGGSGHSNESHSSPS